MQSAMISAKAFKRFSITKEGENKNFIQAGGGGGVVPKSKGKQWIKSLKLYRQSEGLNLLLTTK